MAWPEGSVGVEEHGIRPMGSLQEPGRPFHLRRRATPGGFRSLAAGRALSAVSSQPSLTPLPAPAHTGGPETRRGGRPSRPPPRGVLG